MTDKARVRRVGTDRWVDVSIDLISENRRSLAISADEGLGTPDGFGIDTRTKRMRLFLLKESDGDVYYIDALGPSRTQWEVQLGL